MAKNRLIYQNWITELGFDPEIGLDFDQSGIPQTEERGLADEESGSSECASEPLPLEAYSPSELSDVWKFGNDSDHRRVQLIRDRVSQAISSLSDDEREFIERFYFTGESYRKISEKSGRGMHKLESLHSRAVIKLRKKLAPFVKEQFTWTHSSESRTGCIICGSRFRVEIDCLIAARDRSSTWKGVIEILKLKYGIGIKTPQILIGHEKYH
ncbi:MAG: hypothetical protein SGI97_11340 [candidate division Zixibacteria bacterium]|nr:hypothetical protein [candidate division Zixibacteria bacterium]